MDTSLAVHFDLTRTARALFYNIISIIICNHNITAKFINSCYHQWVNAISATSHNTCYGIISFINAGLLLGCPVGLAVANAAAKREVLGPIPRSGIKKCYGFFR